MRSGFRATGLICAGLLVGACGGNPEESAPAARTPAAFGDGRIVGRVTFEGTAPPPARIRMEEFDPRCKADDDTSELLLVDGSGGLQNVFVHVTEGAAATYAAPEDPVTLDQVGCRYIPHVFGIQVNQPLLISNSDPTVHNVNAVANANRGFNLIQEPPVGPSTRRFDEPEIMVPIRCDVHSWMNAWAGVKTHPFFAVSQADGGFAIERLPPGTYTVEAWHEQLGTQTRMVTMDGTDPVTLNFRFAARSQQ